MLLRREHFAAWRVNWQPKPQNMQEIAEELNIGIDSRCFWTTTAWKVNGCGKPGQKLLCWEACDATGTLIRLPRLHDCAKHACLINSRFTADDRRRGDKYREATKRKQLEQQVGSLEEFLHSFANARGDLPVDEFSFPRVLDLIHKTNQFQSNNASS